MTKTETKTLLAFIASSYPSFKLSTERVDAWFFLLQETPYSAVRDAVISLTKTSRVFAPTPGEVLAACPQPKKPIRCVTLTSNEREEWRNYYADKGLVRCYERDEFGNLISYLRDKNRTVENGEISIGGEKLQNYAPR